MAGLIPQSDVVAAAEAKIESQVPPAQKQNYAKIVSAGMKVALQGGAAGLLGHLTKSKDPIADLVQGSIAIIGILRRQSKGTMPPAAMIPAMMTLILQGLDYLRKAHIVEEITNDDVARATQMFINVVLPKLGVTPDKMQGMMQQAQTMAQDPSKVAAMKQAAAAQGETNGAA